MHILISNDDGYFSEGIKQLRIGLEKTKHSVSMIAPEQNNSACGMSITVRESVNVRKIDENAYAVSGTPVDCIGIGLGKGLVAPVDMVISGINNGPNLADDVMYSGTVAAAVEARRLQYPNIAISMTCFAPENYDTALQVVLEILENIEGKEFDQEITLLNINVPDIPYRDLKGIRVTRLAERYPPQEPLFEVIDDDNQQVRMGGVGEFLMKKGQHAFSYDCAAVAEGYASVTPIQAKYIDTPYLEGLKQMLTKK